MVEDSMLSRADRLVLIEDLMKSYRLVDKKCDRERLINKLKWIELLDYISSNIKDYEGIDYVCKQLVFSFRNGTDREMFPEKLVRKIAILDKVIIVFDHYRLIDKNNFPEDLDKIDVWNSDGYVFGFDNIVGKGNGVIEDLIRFFIIYWKLDSFRDRFITPLIELFKYTSIGLREDIEKKFSELDFLLLRIAMLRLKDIENDEVLYNPVREMIYWIKCITYMHRIPIGVELMKLIDMDPDELYDELDSLEFEKYYGTPDCYGK